LIQQMMNRTRLQRSFAKLSLLASVVMALAPRAGLSAAENVPAKSADLFDFTERFDFTIHVSPLPQDASWVADRSMPRPDLNWVEVVRSRVDRPEPPPPLVPAGLDGVVWAFAHPADSWRLILPIPPEQAPELVLPADPPLRFMRMG